MTTVICPHCGAVAPKVPDDWAGRRVRCRKCNQSFQIPSAAQNPMPPAEPPESEEDDEPYWLNDAIAFARHCAVAPFIVAKFVAIKAAAGWRQWREASKLRREAAAAERLKREAELPPTYHPTTRDIIPAPPPPPAVRPRHDVDDQERPYRVHSEPIDFARIVRRSSFAGGGCGLQGLGCASMILGLITLLTIIGPIVFGLLGLWLFAYGGSNAVWFECSDCGTRLARKRIKKCPGCKARFR